jgi:hypothetical protein
LIQKVSRASNVIKDHGAASGIFFFVGVGLFGGVILAYALLEGWRKKCGDQGGVVRREVAFLLVLLVLFTENVGIIPIVITETEILQRTAAYIWRSSCGTYPSRRV